MGRICSDDDDDDDDDEDTFLMMHLLDWIGIQFRLHFWSGGKE